MSEKTLSVGGIVLCGGLSRRMGTSKAMLPFDGESLLLRVVRLLTDVVRPISVVAAVAQELPPLPAEVFLTRDSVPGQGPLQGLADGLASLQGRADAAFVCGCDAPFLRPDFVRRMIQLLGERDICLVRSDNLLHPLAAVYRLSVLPTVTRLLSEKRRALHRLADELPTRIVAAEELKAVDPDLQSLRNLNTLEDFDAARRETS